MKKSKLSEVDFRKVFSDKYYVKGNLIFSKSTNFPVRLVSSYKHSDFAYIRLGYSDKSGKRIRRTYLVSTILSYANDLLNGGNNKTLDQYQKDIINDSNFTPFTAKEYNKYYDYYMNKADSINVGNNEYTEDNHNQPVSDSKVGEEDYPEVVDILDKLKGDYVYLLDENKKLKNQIKMLTGSEKNKNNHGLTRYNGYVKLDKVSKNIISIYDSLPSAVADNPSISPEDLWQTSSPTVAGGFLWLTVPILKK